MYSKGCRSFLQLVVCSFQCCGSSYSYSYSYLYLQELTCYIKNIRDITMDNKLTTVPDDAATRETNPKKI